MRVLKLVYYNMTQKHSYTQRVTFKHTHADIHVYAHIHKVAFEQETVSIGLLVECEKEPKIAFFTWICHENAVEANSRFVEKGERLSVRVTVK